MKSYQFFWIGVFVLIFLICTVYSLTITDITSSNMIGNIEKGGHGVMWADADGDGDPDLFITMTCKTPGFPDVYFENINGVLTEKAVKVGLNSIDDGTHGWFWADLDNDGDYDSYNGSFDSNWVYENLGNGSWIKRVCLVNKLRLDVDYKRSNGNWAYRPGTRGVVAFDYNNDGLLDIFENNWEDNVIIQDNYLFKNNGSFNFSEQNKKNSNFNINLGAQGVCTGDIDNDGDVDLMVGAFGATGTQPALWKNNIGKSFTRIERAGIEDLGVRADGYEGGHGQTFFDVNSDGWLDLIIKGKIYLNNGNGFFDNNPVFSHPHYNAKRPNPIGIADLNNDGFWDIITVNEYDTTIPKGKYFPGTGRISWGNPENFDAPFNGRSLAFADIDKDGDVDFAMGLTPGYSRLYRNDYDGNNQYLLVRLTAPNGQAGAPGAKVWIFEKETTNIIQYREAETNHGYLMQDDPVLHFGTGSRKAVDVKVKFLDGTIVTRAVSTNQKIHIDASQKNKF